MLSDSPALKPMEAALMEAVSFPISLNDLLVSKEERRRSTAKIMRAKEISAMGTARIGTHVLM